MSSNIEVQKVCELCGKSFTAKTTVTRYCSHKCSSQAYKNRVRQEKVGKVKAETDRVKNKDIEEIKAKAFLTVSDVAVLVGCSRRTAYRLVSKNIIKGTNLGERLIRVKRSDVDNFLALPETSKPTPKVKEYDISECYSVGEAQQKFGISSKALYDTIKRNNIPKFQKGKFVYVPKELLNKIFS